MTASRPASPPGAGENFIPYSMIEPLLVEGMTGREMGLKILAKLRLDPEHYTLISRQHARGQFLTALRGGLYVIRWDDAARSRLYWAAANEPVL